jgi:hypothetical protein
MLGSISVIVFLLLISVALVSLGDKRLRVNRRGACGPKRRGLAITMLVLGWLGLGLSVWGITTVFQGLLALGRLDSAIVSVRTLVDAEAKFARAHPEIGYSCSLSELEKGGSIAEESIKALAQSGQRNGYSFEIRDCGGEKAGKPNLRYHVIARSLHGGGNVCSDQSGIVRFYDPGCDRE